VVHRPNAEIRRRLDVTSRRRRAGSSSVRRRFTASHPTFQCLPRVQTTTDTSASTLRTRGARRCRRSTTPNSLLTRDAERRPGVQLTSPWRPTAGPSPRHQTTTAACAISPRSSCARPHPLPSPESSDRGRAADPERRRRHLGSPPPFLLYGPPPTTRSGEIESPGTGTSSPTPSASSPGLHAPHRTPRTRAVVPPDEGRRKRGVLQKTPCVFSFLRVDFICYSLNQ